MHHDGLKGINKIAISADLGSGSHQFLSLSKLTDLHNNFCLFIYTGITVTINGSPIYDNEYLHNIPFNRDIINNIKEMEFKIKNYGIDDIYKLYQNNETDFSSLCMKNCDPMAGSI